MCRWHIWRTGPWRKGSGTCMTGWSRGRRRSPCTAIVCGPSAARLGSAPMDCPIWRGATGTTAWTRSDRGAGKAYGWAGSCWRYTGALRPSPGPMAGMRTRKNWRGPFPGSRRPWRRPGTGPGTGGRILPMARPWALPPTIAAGSIASPRPGRLSVAGNTGPRLWTP